MGLCSSLRHIFAAALRVRKGLRQGSLSALVALRYPSSKVDSQTKKSETKRRLEIYPPASSRGIYRALALLHPVCTLERTKCWAQPRKALENQPVPGSHLRAQGKTRGIQGVILGHLPVAPLPWDQAGWLLIVTALSHSDSPVHLSTISEADPYPALRKLRTSIPQCFLCC